MSLAAAAEDVEEARRERSRLGKSGALERSIVRRVVGRHSDHGELPDELCVVQEISRSGAGEPTCHPDRPSKILLVQVWTLSSSPIPRLGSSDFFLSFFTGVCTALSGSSRRDQWRDRKVGHESSCHDHSGCLKIFFAWGGAGSAGCHLPTSGVRRNLRTGAEWRACTASARASGGTFSLMALSLSR